MYLIVCEDEQTERVYFENFQPAFPEKTVYITTIGTGLDAKGVVERAVRERKILSLKAEKEVDAIWVVFDKDDADLNEARRQRFEDAFAMAESEKIKTAFSNEVFELWLLLHLTDISGGSSLPRKEVYNLIQEEVRKREGYAEFIYEHGSIAILGIIESIGDEVLAMERAAQLLEIHAGKPHIETNPSTRVHLLVKEVREWIAYYNYIPE